MGFGVIIKDLLADAEALLTKVGTNVDAAGTATLFARLRQVVDTYLADTTFGLSNLETLVDDLEIRLGTPTGGTVVTHLEATEAEVAVIDAALGNATGDMSAVTQSEATTLAAFLKLVRAMMRAHNQTRICLIVPDLANLGSDAPNTAIRAELDKIGTVSVLDEAGVDGGQEDWAVYNLVVVGSNAGGYLFDNDNLDDLITLKLPVMVCNRDVAMHLKMGATQNPSTSDTTEYCETIYNRVMQLVFESTDDKILFSEATTSDRLDMSDLQLIEQVLMVDTTADGPTLVVVGWLPMESPAGALYELNDGTEIPAGRLFAGCFVNADKLTPLGQGFLQRLARNFTQASITPSISLKAQASKVNAIKARTDNLPDDPADQSDVETAITGAHTTTDALLATIDTVVDGIRTEIDNAGYGLAALEALLDTITTVVDANQIDANTIIGLVDSAEDVGPFSYLDAGGEQEVCKSEENTRRRVWIELSSQNMTQAGTFRIYRRVDGANYALWLSQAVTVDAGDERVWDAEFTINQYWRVTYEEDVDETAARSIPFNIITQRIE